MAAAAVAPPQNKETFHLINDPQNVIHDAMTGLTQHYPDRMAYARTHKILYRTDLADFRASGKVTTIGFSGGGHEPMFSGFVGDGFLTAFVSGNVFASPTAAQIFEAIKMCQPPAGNESPGTLVVCGNYTGDVLNAGLAITRAQAAGFKVRFVAVGDDVAVGRKKGGKVGRRGLVGHLVGLKLACALADQGADLETVTNAMEYISANVGTIGVAFDRVSLPNGVVSSLPTLPENTIELGMGAHGEPGLIQLSPPPAPKELVERMVSLLTDTTDADRSFIPFSKSSYSSGETTDNEVVLVLNSLGSTSDSILASFAELASEQLSARGFVVRRVTLGPMVTSLKMSGVGITLWRLPPTSGESITRDDALKLWDSKVEVVSWRQ